MGFSVLESYLHFHMSPVSHFAVSCCLERRGLDCWPFLAGLGDPPAHSLHFPLLCPLPPPLQLSLRLTAMKRQVEEAEEEIDRLESSKKKLQRELEEQMDVNEQLQGQLNSMKKDLRWARASMPPGAVAALTLEGSMMLSEPLLLSPATVATLGSSRPRDDSGCIYSIHPMCSVGISCVILIPLPGVSRAGIILVIQKGKQAQGRSDRLTSPCREEFLGQPLGRMD